MAGKKKSARASRPIRSMVAKSSSHRQTTPKARDSFYHLRRAPRGFESRRVGFEGFWRRTWIRRTPRGRGYDVGSRVFPRRLQIPSPGRRRCIEGLSRGPDGADERAAPRRIADRGEDEDARGCRAHERSRISARKVSEPSATSLRAAYYPDLNALHVSVQKHHSFFAFFETKCSCEPNRITGPNFFSPTRCDDRHIRLLYLPRVKFH